MKTDAQIYRDAAGLIAADECHWCCEALDEVLSYEDDAVDAAISKLGSFFKPRGIWLGDSWWEIGDLEPRIIALLLMAEICEGEDQEIRRKALIRRAR